jgi:hypothetical protein
LGQTACGVFGWLQFWQKNRFERLPAARVF